MLHINVVEAKKHFERMKNQQKRLKENAIKEEQKRKEKEDHIIGFLNKLSGDVQKVKSEI